MTGRGRDRKSNSATLITLMSSSVKLVDGFDVEGDLLYSNTIAANYYRKTGHQIDTKNEKMTGRDRKSNSATLITIMSSSVKLVYGFDVEGDLLYSNTIAANYYRKTGKLLRFLQI